MYIWKSKIVSYLSSFKQLFRSISWNNETRTGAEWRIMICWIFVHRNHPSSFAFNNWLILKCVLLTKYFLAKYQIDEIDIGLEDPGVKFKVDVSCELNWMAQPTISSQWKWKQNLGSDDTAFCNSVLLTSMSSFAITRYLALEQNCAIQCKILRAFQVQFHLSSLMFT